LPHPVYGAQCDRHVTCRLWIFVNDAISDALSDLVPQLCTIYPLVREDISAQQKHLLLSIKYHNNSAKITYCIKVQKIDNKNKIEIETGNSISSMK